MASDATGVGAGLVLFLLVVLMAVWVFTDAKDHSRDSAPLWGLIAFFGGILGVLLYLVVGRE